jgi:hypothetical protein
MLDFGTGFSSLKTIGKRAGRIDELEHFTSELRALLNGHEVTFDQGVEGRISWLHQPGCRSTMPRAVRE